MKDLDKFFSTDDDTFNAFATELYLNFTTEDPLDGEDKFEYYIYAFAALYFFVIKNDNYNKPIACISKLKWVFNEMKFDDDAIIYYLDQMIPLLGQLHISAIFFEHLLDTRNSIRPYLDQIEEEGIYHSHFEKYNFDEVKEVVDTKQTKKDKIDYINHVLFELSDDLYKSNGTINDIEGVIDSYVLEDLSESNFIQRCALLKDRIMMDFEDPNINVVADVAENGKKNKNEVSSDSSYSGLNIISEKLNEFYKAIEWKFLKDDHKKLMQLLEGKKIDDKVYFNGNANQIADALGQMWKKGYINAADQKSVDDWLTTYFRYNNLNSPTDIAPQSQIDHIRQYKPHCKKPIITIDAKGSIIRSNQC